MRNLPEIPFDQVDVLAPDLRETQERSGNGQVKMSTGG